MADAEALFVLHRGRVFRYLCRAVGHVETARDLTQDVFLRVTRAAPPVGTADDQRGWLFSIARNIAIDHRRREHIRPAITDDAPLPARPASQDVTAAVNEALAALPELDRDVFLLREVAGLGYEEIATACALTPDAVRSRIHRARLDLRARLAAPLSLRRSQPMRRSGYSE
jgi:RNA polymerase sigma-70 factor (ECF subfamily)